MDGRHSGHLHAGLQTVSLFLASVSALDWEGELLGSSFLCASMDLHVTVADKAISRDWLEEFSAEADDTENVRTRKAHPAI
jgi:hypothetical protein